MWLKKQLLTQARSRDRLRCRPLTTTDQTDTTARSENNRTNENRISETVCCDSIFRASIQQQIVLWQVIGGILMESNDNNRFSEETRICNAKTDFVVLLF